MALIHNLLRGNISLGNYLSNKGFIKIGPIEPEIIDSNVDYIIKRR